MKGILTKIAEQTQLEELLMNLPADERDLLIDAMFNVMDKEAGRLGEAKTKVLEAIKKNRPTVVAWLKKYFSPVKGTGEYYPKPHPTKGIIIKERKKFNPNFLTGVAGAAGAGGTGGVLGYLYGGRKKK
jgi:hypothetical protein